MQTIKTLLSCSHWEERGVGRQGGLQVGRQATKLDDNLPDRQSFSHSKQGSERGKRATEMLGKAF